MTKGDLYDALVAVGTTVTPESAAFLIARKFYLSDPTKNYLNYARRWYSEQVVTNYFGAKVSLDSLGPGYDAKVAQIALNLFARTKRAKDTRFNFVVANDGNFATTIYVAPANADGSAWNSNLNIGSWALEAAR